MPPPEPNAFAGRVQDGLAGRGGLPVSPQGELAAAEEGFDSLTRPPEISLFGEEGWEEEGSCSPLFGLDSYLRVRFSFGRARTRSAS